jgi:hypothetical protein
MNVDNWRNLTKPWCKLLNADEVKVAKSGWDKSIFEQPKAESDIASLRLTSAAQLLVSKAKPRL